jgi:hypothetical protein
MNLPRFEHDAPEHGIRAGDLMAHSWPGLYPLFYIDARSNVFCPACAREADRDPETLPQHKPMACDANWEDYTLDCDHCNNRIPSAYAEED